MQINSSNTKLTVGTSLVLVSEQKINPSSERVRLILTNTSAGSQKISVAVDYEAVAGLGLVLSPGGSMAWEVQGSYPISQKRVTAIADGAGATLAVYEEVMQR